MVMATPTKSTSKTDTPPQRWPHRKTIGAKRDVESLSVEEGVASREDHGAWWVGSFDD